MSEQAGCDGVMGMAENNKYLSNQKWYLKNSHHVSEKQT